MASIILSNRGFIRYETIEDGAWGEIPFTFNPRHITENLSNNWEVVPVPGLMQPSIRYISGDENELTLTVFVSDERVNKFKETEFTSCREYIDLIEKLRHPRESLSDFTSTPPKISIYFDEGLQWKAVINEIIVRNEDIVYRDGFELTYAEIELSLLLIDDTIDVVPDREILPPAVIEKFEEAGGKGENSIIQKTDGAEVKKPPIIVLPPNPPLERKKKVSFKTYIHSLPYFQITRSFDAFYIKYDVDNRKAFWQNNNGKWVIMSKNNFYYKSHVLSAFKEHKKRAKH